MLPVVGWLPAYRREWLLPDVLAGLAVWAVMVPEGMAYAGIVGVPPIMGLYTIAPPLIAYALLGSSRLLVVGPDTATGLISAITVGAIAAHGTAEFNTLTSTLAILIVVVAQKAYFDRASFFGNGNGISCLLGEGNTGVCD